ncbi:hypothetical protein ACFL5M_06110 [Candidatus Neomarinimicrobiota bacterium]
MTEELNLKELERKAWLSYHQDGLLDIGVGLFILAIGVGFTTGMVWLAGMLVAIGFSTYAGAKQALTVPRVGLVQFGPGRVRREKQEKSFFVIFFTVSAVLGMMMFLLVTSLNRGEYGGTSGPLARTLETMIMAPIGFIGAVGMVALSYWKQLTRYYYYAAILFLAVTVGPLMGIEHPVYTAGAGVVITAAGVVLLVRFLIAYPLKDREEISHVDN